MATNDRSNRNTTPGQGGSIPSTGEGGTGEGSARDGQEKPQGAAPAPTVGVAPGERGGRGDITRATGEGPETSVPSPLGVTGRPGDAPGINGPGLPGTAHGEPYMPPPAPGLGNMASAPRMDREYLDAAARAQRTGAVNVEARFSPEEERARLENEGPFPGAHPPPAEAFQMHVPDGYVGFYNPTDRKVEFTMRDGENRSRKVVVESKAGNIVPKEYADLVPHHAPQLQRIASR